MLLCASIQLPRVIISQWNLCSECTVVFAEQEKVFSKEDTKSFACWRSGVYWTCWLASYNCYWTQETKKPSSIKWFHSSSGILFYCYFGGVSVSCSVLCHCWLAVRKSKQWTEMSLHKQSSKLLLHPLNSLFSRTDDADAAVEARIRTGWNKFRQLIPLLTNRDISLIRRGRLYSS